MADRFGMVSQLAGNAVRLGWFTGLNALVERQSRALGQTPRRRPERPVPSRNELMAAVGELMRRDAEAVRDGIFPARETPPNLVKHFAQLRDLLEDLKDTVPRREARDAGTVLALDGAQDLPDYFAQDFHFQTGGYLSERSARLYDIQVETLFYGAANAMRRSGLRPIARFIKGRDQRTLSLLDVACGTGRFLRDARLAFPALRLTGLDLSDAYLCEAERHLRGLRPVTWMRANAEGIPLADASQDIVTSVFLFHELPPDVRRRVTSEIARVLKPGGLLVFIDSLQMGDRAGWDGLLEAFPERFHEPYYRHYAIDDLEGMFAETGLAMRSVSLAFLAKVMVLEKPAQAQTDAF
jgi:ubiquinone/menaquinone biosynthesis C-methylase UbiE